MRLWLCLPLLLSSACFVAPGISSNPNGSSGSSAGSTQTSGHGGSSGSGAGSVASTAIGSAGSVNSTGARTFASTGGAASSTGATGGGGTTGAATFHTNGSTGMGGFGGTRYCADSAESGRLSGEYTFRTYDNIASSAAVGDLDGDGRQDLVIGIYEQVHLTGTLEFFGNVGDGLAYPSALHLPFSPHDVSVAQLQNNGRLDVIAAGDASFGVARNQGGGQFIQVDVYGAGGELHVADLNGDGFADILVASSTDRSVQVFPNLGDGTFDLPQRYATHSNLLEVKVVDLDGDGFPDVLTYDANTDVRVLHNDRHGGFGTPVSVVPGQAVAVVRAFTVDVDGDGVLDLVLLRTGSVDVLRNDGHGNFALLGSTLLDVTPTEGLVARFQDSAADLVFLGKDAQGTWALHSLASVPSGGYVPTQTLALCDEAKGLRLAELDGNTHPDLVVELPLKGDLGVFLGDGHGRFAHEDDRAYDTGVHVAAVGDLTGDGRQDLVTTFLSDEFGVMLSQP